MTNSLADIMSNKWDEPPEIKAIKDYVRTKFKSNVTIKISEKQIAISAPNAALAATLRMHIVDLQKAAKSDKKLLIRIGN